MKVTKVKEEGRKLPWKLDGYFNGRRMRRFFASKREAEAEMRQLMGERMEAGPAGDRLSPRERIVFADLRDALAERGATMEEAVAFYLTHGAAPVKRMRLWDLLDLAVETKEREGKADRYLRQLESSVGQLCRWEGWGERWAHELTREAVEDWQGGNGWSGKTRRNYVVDVRTVLEFGVRVGAVSRNVTNGMVLPAGTPEGEPGILSVREVARLVAMARRRVEGDGTVSRDGLLLGYVVLGLFAGLRPDRELGTLKWSAVDLKGGTVVVDGKAAKGRRRRVVDLAGNAVALLEVAREWCLEAGMEGVVPRNFRRRWEGLRRSAGLLEGWVPDGMRHSYASYHLALHENEGKLKAQMGHAAGSEVLWQHYRARVTRAEAERFWRIGAGMKKAR